MKKKKNRNTPTWVIPLYFILNQENVNFFLSLIFFPSSRPPLSIKCTLVLSQKQPQNGRNHSFFFSLFSFCNSSHAFFLWCPYQLFNLPCFLPCMSLPVLLRHMRLFNVHVQMYILQSPTEIQSMRVAHVWVTHSSPHTLSLSAVYGVVSSLLLTCIL